MISKHEKIIIISLFFALVPGRKKKIVMIRILVLEKTRRIDKRISERCVPIWFYILGMDHAENLFGSGAKQIGEFSIRSCCIEKHNGCRIPFINIEGVKTGIPSCGQ